MKITRRQLRKIIKEELDIHIAPNDLDDMGPEEAYGVGYYKGKDQDPDIDDDGFLSTAELVDMIHDITDDIDSVKSVESECERGKKLSGKFADEARSKTAALASASKFADTLKNNGVCVDSETISNIYKELLGLARDINKN